MLYNLKAERPFLHDLHWGGILQSVHDFSSKTLLQYGSHFPLNDFIALSTRVLKYIVF